MKTIENNKLIAEFLSVKIHPCETIENFKFLPIEERGLYNGYFIDELKYHEDWNWLMEVVEKIENQYRSKFSKNTFPCVSISSICCKISFYGNHEEVIANIVRPTKIEAVYNAVVEFIKWYNNQNKVS